MCWAQTGGPPRGGGAGRGSESPTPAGPWLTCSPRVLHPEAKGPGQDTDRLDFKIGVEPKDAPPFTVILVASSRQEKAAWTSDISQVGSVTCSSKPERGLGAWGPVQRPAVSWIGGPSSSVSG